MARVAYRPAKPVRMEARTEGASRVYNAPMPKKRVNITIDSAVHDEMRRLLDLVGEDFSTFVERMSVSFLGTMRPLTRRMEAAQNGGNALTPSEVRVLFLQMMGGVQVEAGTQLGAILSELDTIEAEQAKAAQSLLNVPEQKPEVIHTPKPKRAAKPKK